MIGRGRREMQRSRGLRWFAASAGLAVAGSVVLSMAPAQASGATVSAQLSLTGITTLTSPLGGATVGVHPGDSVKFSASSLPTAGLNSLGLGSLVGGLLNTLATYQVTVDFRGLPGGSASSKLSGNASKTFTFPTAGTYPFTWTAQSVTLFGVVPFRLDGNQLKSLNVALNAQFVYTGQVVVATDPPAGSLGLQLPAIAAAPSVGPIQLPTVSVPGAVVGVPNPLPGIVSKLPGLLGPSKTASPPDQAGTPTGPVVPGSVLGIPEQVIPMGNGTGPGTVDNSGFGDALPNSGGSGFGNAAPNPATSTAADGQVTTLKAVSATQNPKSVELAADPSPSAQMPVLLAIIAIIALSLVTATYARLYLLRQPPST